MKKGKYLVLIVAMFIVMMSGCKKKEKTVADDFNDIEGTTMASTDSDADKEQETSEANEADSKSELSVDATVHFDDKAVDIHYDVRAWSADIAGPVPATKKTIDQAYIEALCDRVFDEGQYEDIPSGGDLPEGDVYCNVMGDIDGAVSTLEYSDYYDGWSNTVYIRNQVANWMDMTPDMLAVAEPNALNFDDAMKTAEDYLERWGYENFYCVAYDEITSDFGESALPDGYDIKFQKKIGNSLGVPYTCNCVYDMEHPFPSYMEEINIVISSDGLLHASITDMYEAGTEQQTATIMDVNDMYEKATATIEEYFSGDRYSEEYLESILGDESVWNIYVDLLYVPIAMGDEISYRALYVFSFDLDGLSSKVPLVAFDAYDGTRYNIEMMYYAENVAE